MPPAQAFPAWRPWAGRRGLATAILLALLALAGIETFRLARAYDDLRDGRHLLQDAANRLEAEGLGATGADLDTAEGQFGDASHRLDHASGVLGSDVLLDVASHLPWAGTQVDAARDLTEIGRQSAAMGIETVDALRTVQRSRDREGGRLSERVVPLLEALRPSVVALEESLERVRARRAGMPSGGLLGILDAAVRQFDGNVATLETHLADYERATRMAPAFLGYAGPQTYLVLAHDNNELLPTGGFILVYGFVTVDEGRVARVAFDSVTNIGDGPWPPDDGRTYVTPPAPLSVHLLQNWPMSLAEASWWPDFPTAAAKAIEIYRTNSGSAEEIDGVIGVNFFTLRALLEVLGPITVEQYGETVTADDVIDKTLIITHPDGLRPWETDRYDFTRFLADEIVMEVLAAGPGEWAPLLKALGTLGQEKNLLLYHTDRDVEREITGFGWDGAVAGGAGDYVMVVDSNLRRNKVSQVVESSIGVDVRLDANGGAANTTTITYRYGYSAWAAGKDPRLAELVVGWGTVALCGNYVRLLVPDGSRLGRVTVGGLPVPPEEISTEGVRSVFGRYLSVPVDGSGSVSYEYAVPGVSDTTRNPYEYRLLIQKQPGTRAVPVSIAVSVPADMELVSISVDGEQVEGDVNRIETDLGRDRRVLVRYAPRG